MFLIFLFPNTMLLYFSVTWAYTFLWSDAMFFGVLHFKKLVFFTDALTLD